MLPFLEGIVTPEKYESCVGPKATPQVKRDRKRGRTASVSLYKEAIHTAGCSLRIRMCAPTNNWTGLA